jgi:hypothetical protein
MLDGLRRAFPYVIAIVLPLAGALIAAVRFQQGARDDALRIAAASLLGLCLLALLLG